MLVEEQWYEVLIINKHNTANDILGCCHLQGESD
jgi:hypothetical protein